MVKNMNGKMKGPGLSNSTEANIANGTIAPPPNISLAPTKAFLLRKIADFVSTL